MNIKRTKNIPASVIRDAMRVAGGLYSMNARDSIGYAFDAGKKEVTCGEFVYSFEEEKCREKYDGFIRYSDKTLTDNRSGEVRALK
jgi:hypothetical protein